MQRLTRILVLFVLTGLGCGDEKSTAPDPEPSSVLISSSFDDDLDGWSAGTHANNFGTVTWLDREGGVIKLDGIDFDGDPNAWISKELSLPASTQMLRTSTSAHDRDDGEVAMRVRIVDESQVSHTILDWDPLATEDEGFEFIDQSFDISDYAGQTVTVYFEIGDMDGGGNNQRYIDHIEVHE